MTPRETGPAYDLVVIGGGTAGITAAKLVAAAGRRVALIEAGQTGGECLHTGCVPSKSLLATARTLQRIRQSARLGIVVREPAPDWPAVVARKDRNIAHLGEADSTEALARAGVTVIAGHAHFVDPHAVAIGERLVRGERFVIATGSVPGVPPIAGLAATGYVINEQAFDLPVIPPRLAVIGAGPTGLELGQAFARVGSAVTVLERTDRVLPRDDAEQAELVRRCLEAEGIGLHLCAEVERIEPVGPAKRLTYRLENGARQVLDVDEILVATGRVPRVSGLALDVAGVAVRDGRIAIDDRLRTTARHIWACGDVIGPPFLTHAAEDQARTVAKNILGGRKRWRDRALPWATFTEPEIAGVGLTEAAARERYGAKLEVLRLPYAMIDRAVIDGAGDGQIKVLLAPGWTRGRLGGEIVGAHVVGEHAGDILQEFAFLMAWRLPLGPLAATVAPYPTYALGARQAAGLHWRQSGPRPSVGRPSWRDRLSGLLSGR